MMAKKNIDKQLREQIKNLESKIKTINDSIKPVVDRPCIKISKEAELKHAYITPSYTGKTVITESTWDYVEIYLQKANSPESREALLYWTQSKNFFEATQKLSLISAPLTSYYCFLNATKALLTFKKVRYNLKHGVTGKRIDGNHCLLQNELITLKSKGVLSGLMAYFDETIKGNKDTFCLRDIFYNLPYIHRTFQLTIDSAAYSELFIPIRKPRFVFDKYRKKGWFEAELLEKYTNKGSIAKIVGFGIDNYYSRSNAAIKIRRNKTFQWNSSRNKPDGASKADFEKYYKKIRSRVKYIYNVNDYWFIKRTELKHNIELNPLIITYAAMHRLSELARYQPNILAKHFEKPHSWLLNEFIRKSMEQFIDGIGSEITGSDFRK